MHETRLDAARNPGAPRIIATAHPTERPWAEAPGLARYAPWLREYQGDPSALGAVPASPLRRAAGMLFKCEFALPAGSFKERGAAVLVTHLAARGARRLIEDSSGNAGISIATWAHRLALHARIFVPAAIPAGKRAALQATGAEVIAVEGSREDVARAARAAARADPEAAYASHVFEPLFAEGVQTLLWEVFEELGGRLPETVLVPAGNGTLLLGVAHGAEALLRAGAIARRPAIVGVQARACAPLVRAFETGAAPAPCAAGPTLADGIAIGAPARASEILRAVRTSKGRMVAVGEGALVAAQAELQKLGFAVEPTSAVALAGLRALEAQGLDPGPEPLIPLTGAARKDP